MRKSISQVVATGIGAIALANTAPVQAAPMTSGAAALHVNVTSPKTDVRWWGWGGYYYGPGVYVGPPVYAYPGPYYAPPPPVYVAPPVVYAPPPVPGPTRQCWVSTDNDRGFGYWRAC